MSILPVSNPWWLGDGQNAVSGEGEFSGFHRPWWAGKRPAVPVILLYD